MVKSRFGYRTAVPSATTSKAKTRSVSFKGGVDTYKDNDDLKPSQLASATDARFVRIGRYETRKGLDRYTVPVGETVRGEVAASSGQAEFLIGGSASIAQRVQVSAAGRVTKVDVNIRGLETATGVVVVEVYSDSSGTPGALLGRSTLAPSQAGADFAYVPAYILTAPLVAASQMLWVVLRAQSKSTQGYAASTTSAEATALTSEGDAWNPATFAMNVKVSVSDDLPVKGVIRTYRSNGQKATLFAYGNTVASVNDTTGATIVLKSDFQSGSTYFRAKVVQDAAYFVTGVEKPWKYDFDTWTQLSASPYVPTLIEEHKGLLFFVDRDDKTRLFFSNFGEYDVFTSTDFIYVPAPKSYDALTALAKLNGVLYLFANRNKFQLYGADNDTFSLDEAGSQRGTFTQESCVYDSNFIYHADDDGIWQFDGSGEINLALPFLQEYLDIPDKKSIRLDVFKNRLYCFYTPAGGDVNSECFVINLLLGVYESRDLNTYVGRTFGRDSQDDLFIQASNRVAALYFAELPTNDHSNLGDQLSLEIKTAYDHFGSPAQRKRVPKWRPQFPSQRGSYSIQAGYDLDLRGQPTFTDVSIAGTGPRLNQGHKLNTGLRLGGKRIVAPTTLFIPGPFNRAQRIYKHVAAREPVEVDSEVLSVETQRML